MTEILILGGGVAGLSAGICAQLGGCHATICEQNVQAGGCLKSWTRDGYRIDNCLHWLTGTNPKSDLYRLWRVLDVLGDTEIISPDRLYTTESSAGSLSLCLVSMALLMIAFATLFSEMLSSV